MLFERDVKLHCDFYHLVYCANRRCNLTLELFKRKHGLELARSFFRVVTIESGRSSIPFQRGVRCDYFLSFVRELTTFDCGATIVSLTLHISQGS